MNSKEEAKDHGKKSEAAGYGISNAGWRRG